MDDRQCPICATPIDTTPRPGRPRIYCSPRHRALAWYRRDRDRETGQAMAMTREELLDWLSSLPDPLDGLT
jgi:hypothetical protein